MEVLTTALALLCAWSQPHCQVVQQHPPNVEALRVDFPGGGYTFAQGATHWQGQQVTWIKVSDQMQNPVAIAATLAHESTEVLEGSPPNGKDCDGYEGWSGEDAFLTWFSATFGPPSAPLGSMDNAVLQSVGQHPSRPC